MKKEKMTPEEIAEFNSNVEFNESVASWVMDILSTIIAWPMIILAIRRRMKYKERIEVGNNETRITQ
ncbi:MAG: hypothetical protein IJK85_03140 [Bacteroidales bacterium]|nr:hypothetical protein [Bacteroidales bacterium]